MKVKIIKFDDFFKMPQRAHYNDSGADVFAVKDEIIPAHGSVAVPLGIGVELPDGYDIIIHSKSGLSKKGIGCFNAPVDAGYRGEVHALVYNVTDTPYEFKQGDKVGQLVCRPVVYCDYVEAFGDERGAGAFGSTGK